MKKIFLTFIFFVSPILGYATNTTRATGSGEILGDYEALTLNIVVHQVPESSLKVNAKSSDLLHNLSLYLKNSHKPIQFETKKTTDASLNNDFYWQAVGLGAEITNDINKTKKITYSVQIFVNNDMPSPKKFTDADINDDGVIVVKPVFNKYDAASDSYGVGTSHALAQGLIKISETLTPKVEGIGYAVDDFTTLSATIIVSGLSIDDPSIKPKATANDLLHNLSLYLNNAPNLPIQYKTKSIKNSKFNTEFYWQPIGVGAQLVKDGDNAQKIIYTVQILVNSAIKKPKKFTDADLQVKGSLVFKAVFNKYNSGTGTYLTDTDKALAHETLLVSKVHSSPNGAPPQFKLSPDHKSLVLNWKPEKHSYLPVQLTLHQKPAKVLAMVFHENSGPVDLQASVASLTGQSEQITCRFDKSADPCIQCPKEHEDDAFINSTKPENEDVHSFNLLANSGSYKLTNLEAHVPHVVVLQYERGVKRTLCLTETPTIIKSLTELADPENKQGPAKRGDQRCFIVSAAFGSPFDQHVDIFRWARDRFLNPFPLGHMFVEFYYEHSQPFADAIRDSPKLKAVVRTFLKPLASLLYAIKGSMISEAPDSSPTSFQQELEAKN